MIEPKGAGVVTTLQAWLIAGIPSLALAAILFVGRSPWRSLLGYACLAAGFGVLATVDRRSAALFAGIIALLYASGRGGRMEAEAPLPEARSRAARQP